MLKFVSEVSKNWHIVAASIPMSFVIGLIFCWNESGYWQRILSTVCLGIMRVISNQSVLKFCSWYVANVLWLCVVTVPYSPVRRWE